MQLSNEHMKWLARQSQAYQVETLNKLKLIKDLEGLLTVPSKPPLRVKLGSFLNGLVEIV